MSRLARSLIVLAFLLLPSATTMAQSTPEAEAIESVDSPFAFGLNQGALYQDERGNPVFEVAVTGVELDWQPTEDTWPLDRGMMYVAVDLSVTNLGSRATDLEIYSFTLIDNTGYMAQMAWVGEEDEVWADTVPMDGGETVTGTLVFSMFSDLEPALLMFQPDYTGYVFIYLAED